MEDSFLKLPRKRDKWLMREVLNLGLSAKELELFNKVRIFLQVLFLSDILAANGKTLDQRYLRRREEDESWSTLSFPREQPSAKAFRIWTTTLRRLVPARGIVDRLGEFLHQGYNTANGVTASITATCGRPQGFAYVDLYHVTSLILP